jgi:ribosomal protein L37AE/L43A
MTALELVTKLQRQGFTLRPVEGGKLRIEPGSRLTPELTEQLRRHKPEVLRLLAVAAPFSCPSCGGVATLEKPDASILPTRIWNCATCGT